jgi:hypothetical protein
MRFSNLCCRVMTVGELTNCATEVPNCCSGLINQVSQSHLCWYGMPAWTLTWRGRREVVPVAGGMLGVIVGEPSRSSIATRHAGVGPTVPTSVRREGEKGRQQLACRSHAGGGGGGRCLASRSSSSTSCGERRTAMTLQPTRRHPRSEATSVASLPPRGC